MKQHVPTGGQFLVSETSAGEIFIPEELNEQQRMIGETCREFLTREVFPRLDELDRQEPGLMESLLKKAGQLGLLGVTLPEAYGGSAEGFDTGLLVGEAIGAGHSFAVAFLAHTGIGTLPILYYGSPEQREKYVPALAEGRQLACYCLTEPEAGSDARAAKTRASTVEDGAAYLLNGQKMWITNGGFADIFIVFAKIDDDKDLSAFIVERDFGGITMNPEERKMGIKGSSTRQIFFNDCRVPAANLLSGRGEGFHIAVNILNTGRAKLCAAALGASKEIIRKSAVYALQRVQFALPIARFGAVQHKLGEMQVQAFALESAMYRTAHAIETQFRQLLQQGTGSETARLQSTEEFAVECAILKVYGSECLDYIVDEGVQLFGGMGYSAEGPMERAYRDARINRIFEGTNEINRLLAVDMLLKRAFKGRLNLMGPAREVAGELMRIPDLSPTDEQEHLSAEKRMLAGMKKAVLMIAGAAVEKFKQALEQEQELLIGIADMVSRTYLAESALLRAEKLHKKGAEAADICLDMARVYLSGSVDQLWISGKEAIHSFATGDELRIMQLGLKRFTKGTVFNTKAARRRIAEHLLSAQRTP